MPLDLSVTEAARLIGVSRARIYQRTNALHREGRLLPTQTRTDVPLRGVAVQRGRQIRIPLADALVWRAERQAHGLPVGPMPHGVTLEDEGIVAHDLPTTEPEPVVGLPTFRPF
jgi:hypothetical protein